MTPPPDDAMRRAEKIIKELQETECGAFCTDWPFIIAAEIRAAVEEEAQLRADWNVVIEELQKALANAYEVAAQIAGSNCLGNAVNGVTNETCPTANLIRAKAKESL